MALKPTETKSAAGFNGRDKDGRTDPFGSHMFVKRSMLIIFYFLRTVFGLGSSFSYTNMRNDYASVEMTDISRGDGV